MSNIHHIQIIKWAKYNILPQISSVIYAYSHEELGKCGLPPTTHIKKQVSFGTARIVVSVVDVDVDATNGACGDHLEDGWVEGLRADGASRTWGPTWQRSPCPVPTLLLPSLPPFALTFSGPVSRSKPTTSSPRLPVLPCWKGSSFGGAAAASPPRRRWDEDGLTWDDTGVRETKTKAC